MANETQFDKAAIDTVGKDLQSLMDGEMAVFENLKAHWPNAGKFATAQWIERMVDDRRNAIVAHGERLNLTLKELGQRLQTVAAEFENADGENAGKIKAAFEDQAGATREDLNSQAANTESAQGNFSGAKDQSKNNSDGDGYNDVLPGWSGGSFGDPGGETATEKEPDATDGDDAEKKEDVKSDPADDADKPDGTTGGGFIHM